METIIFWGDIYLSLHITLSIA